jgi:hypothetical protein
MAVSMPLLNSCGGDDEDSVVSPPVPQEQQEPQSLFSGKVFAGSNIVTKQEEINTNHDLLDQFKKVRNYGPTYVLATGEATETSEVKDISVDTYNTIKNELTFIDDKYCKLTKYVSTHWKEYNVNYHLYTFQFNNGEFWMGSEPHVEELTYDHYRYNNYVFPLSLYKPYCFVFEYYSDITFLKEYDTDMKIVLELSWTYVSKDNKTIEFTNPKTNKTYTGELIGSIITLNYDTDKLVMQLEK